MEHHGSGPADGTEGAGEPAYVAVALYAFQANGRDVARLELGHELVRHDAQHHRIEPLPVEVVEQTEQMTFDAAEGVPLHEVDDPDRVLSSCLV